LEIVIQFRFRDRLQLRGNGAPAKRIDIDPYQSSVEPNVAIRRILLKNSLTASRLIFVDKLKKEGLGPAAIAKRLRISRASVYRAMAA
jgi:hypothetical protein